MTRALRHSIQTVVSALLLLGLVAGCSEETTTNPNTNVDRAQVIFFHGAADLSAVDVRVDNDTVVKVATRGGSTSSYVPVEAGDRRIRVSTLGAIPSTPIDLTVNFVKDAYYSTFVLTDSNGNPGVLRFQDDLSAPASGKAHIRLVHLVPDGPEVKLSFAGSGLGAILEKIEFSENTSLFQVVDAGSVMIRIQEQTGGGGGGGGGGSSGLVPDIDQVLEDGGIYTIVLAGKVADNNLGAFVIKHDND